MAPVGTTPRGLSSLKSTTCENLQRSAALASVALIIASACGGDDEPSGSLKPTPTTDSATARNTRPPAPAEGQIAFLSDRDGSLEVYVVNADSSNIVRLANNLGQESDPTWSPDGNRIAFATDVDGNIGVYAVNVDGSGLAHLTENPAADFSPPGRLTVAVSPSGPTAVTTPTCT